MAINYGQGYINEVLQKAEVSISVLAYNDSQYKARGFDTTRFEKKFRELFLYYRTLKRYSTTTNYSCLTDANKDLMIDRILDLIDDDACICSKTTVGCLSDSSFLHLLQANGVNIPL